MKVLQHFKHICALPHCSFGAQKLRDYLAQFATDKGCSVAIDESGNIHAHKGNPQVCLQAHYDMVCVGTSCKGQIELVEKDGWLSAKDSTLGADNGMGLAIAMQMMEEFSDFEALFTADEEVGLIGANNCEHEIIAPRLLNLDSEDDSEVIIGCAASFMAQIYIPTIHMRPSKRRLFTAKAVGFRGGHSGIDISKGIKSALVEMIKFIRANNAELVYLKGGERSNSISVGAEAMFYADEIKESFSGIEISECEYVLQPVIHNDITMAMAAFKHGVFEVDLERAFVLASANLSIINADEGAINISIMARAASCELLDDIRAHIRAVFGHIKHVNININERDEPWQPIESEFSHTVLAALRKERPHAKAAAIHAGLECGVLKAKQPALECASIGPNIRAPHSVHERCELASVEVITKVVRDILNHY